MENLFLCACLCVYLWQTFGEKCRLRINEQNFMNLLISLFPDINWCLSTTDRNLSLSWSTFCIFLKWEISTDIAWYQPNFISKILTIRNNIDRIWVSLALQEELTFCFYHYFMLLLDRSWLLLHVLWWLQYTGFLLRFLFERKSNKIIKKCRKVLTKARYLIQKYLYFLCKIRGYITDYKKSTFLVSDNLLWLLVSNNLAFL